MNAKNNGITKEEMAEILTHIAFYAGWPNAWAAFNMAKEIYADEIKNPKETNVFIANVKHWHGAKKNSWFSHLAVEVPGEETRNEWCEKVTDEEYNNLD